MDTTADNLTIAEYKVMRFLLIRDTGSGFRHLDTKDARIKATLESLTERGLVKRAHGTYHALTKDGLSLLKEVNLGELEDPALPPELVAAQHQAYHDIIVGAFNNPNNRFSEDIAESVYDRSKALTVAIAPNLLSAALLRNKLFTMLWACLYLESMRKNLKATGRWHSESEAELRAWGDLVPYAGSVLEFVEGNFDACSVLPVLDAAYHTLVGLRHKKYSPEDKVVDLVIANLSTELDNVRESCSPKESNK